MRFKEACSISIVAAIFVCGIQAIAVANPQPSDWFGGALHVKQDISKTEGTQQRYRNSYSDGSYGIFSHQRISNGEGQSILISYNVYKLDGNLNYSKEKSYPLTNGGDNEIEDSIEQYRKVINQQERKADEGTSGSGNFAEFKDRVSYNIEQKEGTNQLVLNSDVFENNELKMSKMKMINLATGGKSEIEQILKKNKSLIRVGPKKKKSKGKKTTTDRADNQVARTRAFSVKFSSSIAGGVTSIAATCKTYVNGSRVKKFTNNYTANNQQDIVSIKDNFKRNVCK